MKKEMPSRSGSSAEGLRKTSYQSNVPLENASSVIKDKTIDTASDVSNEISDSCKKNRNYLLSNYEKRKNNENNDNPEINYCIIRSSYNYSSNFIGSFKDTTEKDFVSKQCESETEYEKNDTKKEDNCRLTSAEKKLDNVNSPPTNIPFTDNSASEVDISKTDLDTGYNNPLISNPFNNGLSNKNLNSIARTRKGPVTETLACRTPNQGVKNYTTGRATRTKGFNNCVGEKMEDFNNSGDLETIRTRITPRNLKRTYRQPRPRSFVIPDYTKRESFMDLNPLAPRFISPRFACKQMRFFFNGPISSQADSLALKEKKVIDTCPTGENVTEVSTNEKNSKTRGINKDSQKIADDENLLSLAARLDEPEEMSSVFSKNEDMRTILKIKNNLNEGITSVQREDYLGELMGWTLTVFAFSVITGIYSILSVFFK